jgi:serine/threonine protein kinase
MRIHFFYRMTCTWYVDPILGKKNGTGTIDQPFSTIQAAVERASSGDTILLKPGDYELNKDIVISEMAVLHIAAFSPNDRPRLLDWGIQLQATQGMISNITISDIIIESSRALRIIGTVNDITIERTDFLMIGPATEDVIKLDRLKLGGDGTDPERSINGIRFVDCVFDTRNSYTVGIWFFSWRLLIGPNLDSNPGNQLIFERVKMRGGTRGPLMLFFEAAPFIVFKHCQLSNHAYVSSMNPLGWQFLHNTLDDAGLSFKGNVSDLNIFNNTFLNFGRTVFPSDYRPVSLSFLSSPPFESTYRHIHIKGNVFKNYTNTNDEPGMSFAAIQWIRGLSPSATFEDIVVHRNDFSQLAYSSASNVAQKSYETYQEIERTGSSDASSATFSSEINYHRQRENVGQDSVVLDTIESLKSGAKSKFPIRPVQRTGPFAIISQWDVREKINASINYYGDSHGPSSCCNQLSSPVAPRVSHLIQWYPWCQDSNCSAIDTVESEDCFGCSPQLPLMPVPKDNSTFVVILVSGTLALIVVIVGLTGLYCFTRPKNLDQYRMLSTDGWRSRLLASVPDVQALFDQFGVPLIHYEDLILNPIPIGTGSFGSVYDGVLANADHIVLHQELHTLMDSETLSRVYPGEKMPSYMFEPPPPTLLDETPLPTIIDMDSQTPKKNGKKEKQEKKSKSSKDPFGSSSSSSSGAKSPSGKGKKKAEPRPIAVKVLNSIITDSYDDINQFLEEIKIMASIDHPNLLKLRGVAIDPITENILLVMDLMDLGSLDDVLFKKKTALTFARKLAIATEIGYALHYLHSKEPAICHRDLKPGNVLVSRKWNIKVCDFGSSRVLDRKTATMTIKGTPIYLAPESINSSKFSEKSDVYSYGVTLVELFGGTRAFDDVDGTAANLMIRIAVENLRPTIPKDLPNSLKSLLRRCMATDPDDRPNFTDILEKLAEVLAASADSAPSTSGNENPSPNDSGSDLIRRSSVESPLSDE